MAMPTKKFMALTPTSSRRGVPRPAIRMAMPRAAAMVYPTHMVRRVPNLAETRLERKFPTVTVAIVGTSCKPVAKGSRAPRPCR